MVKLLLGLDRSTFQIPFEKLCEIVDNLRLDGIEIQIEHPDIFKIYPAKAITYINEILSNYKFELSCHTPIKDLNISSYNPAIRNTSINEIKRSIEFANKINAKYIVTHGGKNSFKKNSSFSIKNQREALNYTIDALKAFNDLCKNHGIAFSVENMTYSNYRMSSKIKYLKKIFNEIQDLKLTLDIDHAVNRIRGNVDKFIYFFSDRLISSHISSIFQNVFYIKQFLALPNLKLLVLEPHSLNFLVRPYITRFIEKNIADFKKIVFV